MRLLLMLAMFGGGRIIYSAVERHDKWFLLVELIFSFIFISVGAMLLKIPYDSARGISLGLLFILTAFAPRRILPVHPIEAGGDKVTLSQKIVPLGIIDFVWICIMGGTLAFTSFTVGVSPFTDTVPCGGLSPIYYQKSLDTTVFLLGKTIDSIFLLGGILAVCMAILWAGEIWRRSDNMARTYYVLTTKAAKKMVVAFFTTALNALVWIGVPLYNRMIILVDLLKDST